MKRILIIFAILFSLISCKSDSLQFATQENSALRLVKNRELIINVDYRFDYLQEKLIAEAISEWSIASDGVIKFKVYWNQPRESIYSYSFSLLNPRDKIFIYSVNKNDSKLTEDLREYFSDINGLYVPGFQDGSNLLIFEQVPMYHFKAVVLHEIGHLLGLMHLEEKDHVMSSASGSYCLTFSDIEYLCSYYNCIPKSMC